VKGARPIGLASAIAVGLVGVYAALGGASYAPAAVADPCESRVLGRASGVAESVEQVVLSAADGAACALGASREDLILALRGQNELERFADEHGIDQGALEQAIREGLVRAVDDAEVTGSIEEGTANVLRTAAEHLPIGILLTIIRGGSALF
jgi:hypothetical protein